MRLTGAVRCGLPAAVDSLGSEGPLKKGFPAQKFGLSASPLPARSFSNKRGSLHGLGVAAAFGKWPGFVLMLTAIVALFTVRLLTAFVIGRMALTFLVGINFLAEGKERKRSCRGPDHLCEVRACAEAIDEGSQPTPLLKSITSLQFGRGSTHPTLPHSEHLRCAQISYQSHSGRSSSFNSAEWWQRGPAGRPMQ